MEEIGEARKVTYTTMETAVRIEWKPTQVNIANLLSVRMLATNAVQSAATLAQTRV
jgi:hypothetical protein